MSPSQQADGRREEGAERGHPHHGHRYGRRFDSRVGASRHTATAPASGSDGNQGASPIGLLVGQRRQHRLIAAAARNVPAMSNTVETRSARRSGATVQDAEGDGPAGPRGR